MAAIGRTLFRFGGALLLGASATSIDTPSNLFAPARSRVPTVTVVVAATDIPEGRVIDRAGLAVAQWPAGTQPARVYASIDSVANRVTRVRIFKGEAIVASRLAPAGTAPGPEVKITPGKRAYSIRIDDVGGVADLVPANSRVDVLVVLDGAGRNGHVAKLIMENMRVLAMGRVAQRNSDESQARNAIVATLEVTPDEAEVLAVAASQGELQLMLRGYGNPGIVPSPTGPAAPECDQPRRGALVRDLLMRTCASELRFEKDSGAIRVRPGR
jgi:pilus assembly protein CpaB